MVKRAIWKCGDDSPMIFNSKLKSKPIKEEIIEKKDDTKLDWNPIEYLSAKMKYRFNIYSMKMGNITHYMIGQSQPRTGWWTELSGKPGNVSFEEARTTAHWYCRILRLGVPERPFDIKIERKTT